MARSADQILVTEEGEVVVEGRDARFRLQAEAGRYWLLSEEAGVIVLRKVLPGEGAQDDIDRLFDENLFGGEQTLESGGRVILAGEVISSMTLFQIIEIISNRNWQGDLRVYSSDGDQFTLSVDQGALRHAKSNSPDDRLGQTLVAESVITEEQLDELLGEVTPSRRLGRLAVERGHLTQEELYEYLGKQVKRIFFHTLLVQGGSYVFTSPDPSDPAPGHTVHLPVQALLMEGIQRVDEMELFREKIPTDEVVLQHTDKPPSDEADEVSTAVYRLADGTKSLRDIASAAGLDEFKVTKAAYYLLKERRIELEVPDRVDVEALQRSAAAFNSALRELFACIAEHGGTTVARETLGAWIAGSGYASYFGEGLSEEGTFDEEHLVETLRTSRDADPLETLHQLGHELVSFALFSAGTVLPRDAEKQLSYDINHKLQQIRSR